MKAMTTEEAANAGLSPGRAFGMGWVPESERQWELVVTDILRFRGLGGSIEDDSEANDIAAILDISEEAVLEALRRARLRVTEESE